MEDKIFAGAVKTDVTPPVGYILQGHSDRNKPSQKVHDPLLLKVLSIRKGKERAILVTSDLVAFYPEFVTETRNEITRITGIKKEQVLLTASHTHTGPVMGNEATALPEYLSFLRFKIAGAVKEAVLREEPVRVKYGRGKINIGIINRRKKTAEGVRMMPNPKGPIDEDVALISFENAAQKPMALFFNYTCHPTTLSSDIYQISGDYPGVAQRELEKFYPGVIALFSNGCCGDVRPAIIKGNEFAGGTFADIERMGKLLAAEVIQAQEKAELLQVNEIKSRSEMFNFPFNQKMMVRDKKSLEKVFRQYSYDKNKPLEHEIAWKKLWWKKLQNGEKIPDAEIGELQVLKIGKLTIVGLPGEVMVEIGLKLKKAVKDIIIAGYANGILDYIPTSSALKEGGYEATS
ncbi:MAG: neutral/alkaline non-lysosomal ceramidase N-terminal domain-containing protein, partial [Candidatus Omnitrophica bacterium]|nr:neutral/alkaline non-lysosomal ceramidase N-terminal domain-containing protein [Candidatus Omnitrophota bacterium]